MEKNDQKTIFKIGLMFTGLFLISSGTYYENYYNNLNMAQASGFTENEKISNGCYGTIDKNNAPYFHCFNVSNDVEFDTCIYWYGQVHRDNAACYSKQLIEEGELKT